MSSSRPPHSRDGFDRASFAQADRPEPASSDIVVVPGESLTDMEREGDLHSADELRELARAVLERAGAPPATARTVADSLVEANLRGHDSHGVRRLVPYTRAIRDGHVDPAGVPEFVRSRGAVAIVDGRRGFGQLAARLAVAEAAALAREHGAAAVAIRRCTHVGRLGEWVEALALEGLVALAFCNSDPTVAPFGGRERRLGTNPLAWAAPRAAPAPPLVMDWATAATAEGKLAVAQARGDRAPAGVLIDAAGRPSDDPADFYGGGALLPFGAHKGSGLSVMIELVGGALSQVGLSTLAGHDDGNGTVLIALDVAAFVPPEEFAAQAEAFCAALAATAPADGFDEVLVPGEIENRTRARRAREGAPLPPATWAELQAL
jgi:LDH2 family malate/lactate/ureidoglycolate dehydrogenase